MKRVCSVILLFFSFFLLTSCGNTKHEIALLMEAKFEPILKNYMDDQNIPGFTVAVVKENKIVYKNAFGLKSLESKEEMTTTSLFHQASLTKPFVATCIMQLVEKGKISLDDPVIKYLPYFKINDERYKTITIRQMVTHTSGMPDVMDYEWNNPVYDDNALERYVRSLTEKELIAAPGEIFRYSNMAFEVLGDLIAKVSGLSFEEYVQENMLTPLKMKNSTLLKKEANEKLLTTPHILEKGDVVVSKVYPYNRMHAPSSTMISNVEDMSRWAMANLNYGELDGKRILKNSTYDIMWTRGEGVAEPVGISWFIGDHNGLKTVSHSGGDTGYRSYIILVPEKSLGIVMASNYDRTPINNIVNAALAIALGEDYTPPKIRKDISVNQKTLDKFVGKYQLEPEVFLNVTRRENRLFVKATGQPEVELFAETETNFFLKVAEIEISFKKNDKGEVFQLILHQGGMNSPAKKIE